MNIVVCQLYFSVEKCLFESWIENCYQDDCRFWSVQPVDILFPHKVTGAEEHSHLKPFSEKFLKEPFCLGVKNFLNLKNLLPLWRTFSALECSMDVKGSSWNHSNKEPLVLREFKGWPMVGIQKQPCSNKDLCWSKLNKVLLIYMEYCRFFTNSILWIIKLFSVLIRNPKEPTRSTWCVRGESLSMWENLGLYGTVVPDCSLKAHFSITTHVKIRYDRWGLCNHSKPMESPKYVHPLCDQPSRGHLKDLILGQACIFT